LSSYELAQAFINAEERRQRLVPVFRDGDGQSLHGGFCVM
jgi:hypothetical protein